jgi:broad specificity phosphatase PhoE
MKIYFARHGESQANLLHVISNRQCAHSLTDVGYVQAFELAKWLKKLTVKKIFTSPLLRAIQTADILADYLQVPCEQVDGLREFDCGIAEGRSDRGAWALWQAEFNAWIFDRDYEFKIVDGESFYDMRKRFEEVVSRILVEYGGTSSEIVCISHGGIYSVMLPLIISNITPEMVVNIGFEYTSCIVVEERAGGLVGVEWNGDHIG